MALFQIANLQQSHKSMGFLIFHLMPKVMKTNSVTTTPTELSSKILHSNCPSHLLLSSPHRRFLSAASDIRLSLLKFSQFSFPSNVIVVATFSSTTFHINNWCSLVVNLLAHIIGILIQSHDLICLTQTSQILTEDPYLQFSKHLHWNIYNSILK